MFTKPTLKKAFVCQLCDGLLSRRLVVAVLCGGAALGMASRVEASNPRISTPRLRPPVSQSGQPLLGFVGQMQFGYGLVVQSVFPGSLAEQIGLEPGDVITALNGQRVLSLDMYYSLLRNSGGVVQMDAIDCRTGNPAGLDFYLDNGASGPVVAAPANSIRRVPNMIRPNTSGYRPAGTSSGSARPSVIRRY